MTKIADTLTFRHGATIKNRMVQPPMLTNSGDHGFVTEDTIKYWQARANSAGMITTEYVYVTPEGGPALSWAPNRTQLAIYDDKFVPGLKKLATAMKLGGNKAIIQLAHTGREANGQAAMGQPVYAPSAIDFDFLPYKVTAFTNEQVLAVIDGFGKAAKRAIDAGFDGILIHGANHYLIQQFFSPFSNKRTDNWGGSLEKRMNFAKAVSKAVFDVIEKYAPKDFIVGYRISPEELDPNNEGYTWHESTKLIKELTDEFPFDYIDLSLPQYNMTPSDSDETFAQLFRPVIGKETKLGVVGNVRNAHEANDALRYANLVSAGRASLADPNFAKKIIEGRENEVVTTITPDNADEAALTPGLKTVFAQDGKDLRPSWPKDMTSGWKKVK